jgi:membrane-bound lytic murein transglycosylase A
MLTPPAPWAGLCPEFRALEARADGTRPGLRTWIEARFAAWPLLDAQSSAEGLITGYYEPLLTGSRIRERPEQVPLYARPADLLTIDLTAVEPRLAGMRLRGRLQGQRVVPYFSRADIDTSTVLAGQELVWVDDAIDAFFLEIQGSGRVALRDGSTMRVGYADQNGHPYRAIGRTLIDQGALRAEDVSAPAIRDWLRANPAQARAVMHSNPSAVFFRELPAVAADTSPAPSDPDGSNLARRAETGIDAGPPGSLGVPLTGLRSIAVDRRVIPLASLVWLDTTDPIDTRPLQRAMLAQDTGGAITGKIRADVFWGFGQDAGRAAGLMKARGRMWVLWPKEERFPVGQ